jgi:hypothetical protein
MRIFTPLSIHWALSVDILHSPDICKKISHWLSEVSGFVFKLGACQLKFYRVVLSSPQKFFKSLDEDYSSKLCTWIGELYLELHQGTFTVQAKVSCIYITYDDW